MEKPGKKLKKLIIIIGTTGAVYAGLKYLLPLVAPFFVGYLFALMLRPSARFLSYRLRIQVKGRKRHLPIGVVGGVEFLILLSLLGLGLYWGMVKLCQEGKLLAFQLPIWVEQFDGWLTGSCRDLERTFGLRPGGVADVVSEMLTGLIHTGKQAAMPALMTNSVAVIRLGVKVTVVSVVLFLAVVLSLQEMDDLRERRDQSVFRREFSMIGKRIVHTGNPLRGRFAVPTEADRLEGLAAFGLDAARPTVLVVGGSLGCRTLNETMKAWLARQEFRPPFQVIWQTGKYYEAEMRRFLEEHPAPGVWQGAFIDRMDRAYAAADVVVSRSGACSVSELCLVGKPTLFVPSPNVAEDHQTKNAQALVDRQAAVLVADAEAPARAMETAGELLADPARRTLLARNIAALAVPDAAERIVDEIEKIW